jgi:hypothetical protein
VLGSQHYPPSGVFGNPTIIKAETAGTVTLKMPDFIVPGFGADIKPSIGGSDVTYRFFNPVGSGVSYITFDGLILDGNAWRAWDCVKMESAAHHIIWQNCKCLDGWNTNHKWNNTPDCEMHFCELINGGSNRLGHNIYLSSCNNFKINDNDFHDSIGYGLTVWQNGDPDPHTVGGELLRNRSWANGLINTDGGGGLDITATQVLIANNLCWNNGAAGISARLGSNKIYNNTCFANGADPGSGWAGIHMTVGGNTIRNNISYGNFQGDFLYGGGTQSNNQSADPLFVNESIDPLLVDFHLQETSTAINAGIDLTSEGITNDFDLLARPQEAAFEIGAYEFVPLGDFFVAQNDPAASDSNPGTVALPFLTIGAALSALTPQAGEVVIVKEGTYNESLMATPSGTSWANAATIRANPGDTVVLTKSGSSVNRIATFNSNHSYIIIDGFVINDTAAEMWNAFKFDFNCHHIRIMNCDISTCRHSGIQDSSNSGIGGHEILFNTLHDNGRITDVDGRDHGVYMVSANSKVWGNVAYGNSGYGIQLWPATDNDNCDIQYNECYSNGAIGDKGGMTISGNNCLVANNLIYENDNGGLYMLGGNANLCYNNTVADNGTGSGGGGVVIQSSNCLVTNNIAFGNGGLQIRDLGSGTVLTTNVTSDPLFVDAANDDYHLDAGSVAKTGGTTLAEVTDDFDRILRPQNTTYSIGAYEGLL